MDILFLVVGSLGAYLLGSIPSAVWIGTTFYGIDVREHGSGNAGATNTLRVLGKKAGFIVLFVDCLKGLAAGSIALMQNKLSAGSPDFHNMQMVIGGFAVLGHIYPIFAGFKGGKGIATLLGLVIAISWPISLMCALTFVFTVWLTRYFEKSLITICLSMLIIIIIIISNNNHNNNT
jgi:glycerol-3-phosphate acyltransferase PlsY